MSIPEACKDDIHEELDRRFLEYDKHHKERIETCRNDVDENLTKVIDALQKVSAQQTVIMDKVNSLQELNSVWVNYKGFSNTIDALFGRSTWVVWAFVAALIYAINHNFKWPSWGP